MSAFRWAVCVCTAPGARALPGQGDPCPLSTWGDGLFCIEGTCRPPLGLGQPCVGSDICDEHLVCFEGKCVVRPGLGESCTDDGPRATTR